MTADTEQTIDLDRKTRAIRSGNRWAVQKLRPDGDWDMVTFWNGSRRSVYQWCEGNDVHPTREAIEAIDAMPEMVGFRERG